MSYAVLFKIYFVDSFVIRQLERLKARVGHGHVYVIADETHGTVGPIPHDRTLRPTEADMIARGFVNGSPGTAMFWHSADCSLYYLFDEHPAYDHYVTIEYDAVINDDLDRLVADVAASGIDFVGEKILKPASEWPWTRTCNRIYDVAIIRPYLNAIAFYSARSVPLLRSRRLELSRQYREGEIDQFPLSEAFIATELERAGMTNGSLSAFGDTSEFDWWPPSNEADLDSMGHCTFIHPLLEGERYVDSLLRNDKLLWAFRADSPVAEKLRRLPARDYVPKLMTKLVNRRRPPDRLFTTDEIKAPLFERPDPSPNIAIGKPATQSSVSPSSRARQLRQDAGGAVSGLVTGSFSFHTGLDNPPWWMVDLEGQYRLSAIWVFNRIDMPGRARHLKIFISPDGDSWTQLLDRRSDRPFGGAYGEPLMVTPDDEPIARFVRLELSGEQYLHLDQVKVFGVAAESDDDT